jgi:type II secretory pathway predicted ATPase ExeA
MPPSAAEKRHAASPSADLERRKSRCRRQSLSVEKNSITLAALISTLCYDLSWEKHVQIPKQNGKRERELQEIVKNGKRPMALSSTRRTA